MPLAAPAQEAHAARRRAHQRQRRGRSGVARPDRGVPPGNAGIGLDRRPQLADRHPWTLGYDDRILANNATELAALMPDVILATGSNTVRGCCCQAQPRAVPIVFVYVPDPVGAGYVDSLARPGGNVTGFTQFEYSMSVKWLELLKQLAPQRDTGCGASDDPTVTSDHSASSAAIQGAAASFGVEVVPTRRARRVRHRARHRGVRAGGKSTA